MIKQCMILAIIIFCICLIGCGSEIESQNDYESNQLESFYDINFYVPEQWEKEIDSEKTIRYVELTKENEPQNSLTLTLDSNMELEKSANETWNALETAKKNGEGITSTQKSSISIASMSAIKMEYTQEMEDESEEITSILIFLRTENETIAITFASSDKNGIAYFNKFIDSIKQN